MDTAWAEPLLAMYPRAATYDNQTLILTGEYPVGFQGEEVRICDMDLTHAELVERVDDLRIRIPHTGKLVVISKEQGLYLYTNHDVFKPSNDEV